MEEDNKYQNCNICCNDQVHFISCKYCKFTACNSCNESFILNEIINPRCMNCNKEWSNDYLYEIFSRSFLKGKYKNKKEETLFELEKSMLSQSQINLEKIDQANKIKEDIKMYENLIFDLKLKLNELINKESYTEPIKTANFIKNCPNKDCRGFLNDKFKCSLCSSVICKHCLEINLDDHKCDQNILENLKLLKTDSKNCPSCSVLIYKLEGCDQMFCVNCKTAFDWRTKKIVNGPIHNPHYFDYLFSQNKTETEQKEDTCNDFNHIYLRTFMSDNNNVINRREIAEFGRFILHIEDEKYEKYDSKKLDEINEDIRQQYLLNKISEKEFKSLMFRRFKKKEYYKELSLILDMFINVCKDIFYKIEKIIQNKNNRDRKPRVINLFNDQEYLNCIKEIINVQEYVKESVTKLSERYEYKVPELTACNPYIINILKAQRRDH